MFGTNNNDNQTQADPMLPSAPVFDTGAPATDQVAMSSETPSYLPSVPAGTDNTDTTSDDAVMASLVSDNNDHDSATNDSAASDSTHQGAALSDDLLKLKQQALQQLTPLVGHLDQSAEDRFRTFMMMIQASDDKSLINSAYEAAQQIEDEKARAQALLDVVNEINYFTQQEQTTSQE